MKKFDTLKEEVRGLRSASAAMRVNFDRFADEVEASKNDPVEIQAIVDEIRAEKEAIIAATLEHTPAAEPGGGGDPEPAPTPNPGGGTEEPAPNPNPNNPESARRRS